MKPFILLDTDPGTDDIFALLWLCAIARRGGCEIAAVTSCAGNVVASQTYSNACRVLSMFGFPEVPVGKGTPYAEGESAAFHGVDGLGGTSSLLPVSDREKLPPKDSAELIVETLQQFEPVIVIGIGPCTNLEQAEQLQPGILKKAQQIVLMGGALDVGGNVTSLAEFNVWFNPQSFKTVLGTRHDTMVLPLDITIKTLFSHNHLEKVKRHCERYIQSASNAKPAEDCNKLLPDYLEIGSSVCLPGAPKSKQLIDFVTAVLNVQVRSCLKYTQAEGFPGMPMHDGATLVGLFYPETLQFMRAHLDVETNLACAARGLTMVDRRHNPLRPQANSYIATDINVKAAMAYFIEDLKLFFENMIDEEINQAAVAKQ